jgi:hypothetical protein
VLALLLTGTASIAQPASKPYKVCPEVVTAKDTPCRVATPTASIVHRTEIEKPPVSDLELENKILKEMIEKLVTKIEELEKENTGKK